MEQSYEKFAIYKIQSNVDHKIYNVKIWELPIDKEIDEVINNELAINLNNLKIFKHEFIINYYNSYMWSEDAR